MPGVPLLNDYSVKLDPNKDISTLDDNDAVPWRAVRALADQLVAPVKITIPSMPDGVAGALYELPLTASGYGEIKTWSEAGDEIPNVQIVMREDGVQIWRVTSAPAAGDYTKVFRVTNGLTSDEVTFAWHVAASVVPTVINSTVLSSIIVGQDAVCPLDVSGTPPFKVRVSAGGPLPSGVSPVPGEVQSLAASWVIGQALVGSEGAGVSTTVEVTGQGGVATKVFASGMAVYRKPDITNPGTIQIPAGSSGSFQLAALGYPVPTWAKDAGETWPAGITINAAGLISWTDQSAIAGTTTGNLRVTATNAAGADTDVVKFQILAAASNTPPLAAKYWRDAEAGLAVTGGLVDSWTDQQAGAVASASGYNKPAQNAAGKTVDFAGGTTRTNLAHAAFALSVPWYGCIHLYIPAGIADGVGRRIVHDTSGDPRVVYNDNGSSQHRIAAVFGGVTVYGNVADVLRGAMNIVEFWLAADGSGGFCVNGGTDATFPAGTVASPPAWSGLIYNGTTDTTSFAMRIHRDYAREGIPNSTQRGTLRTWVQGAWSGGTPPAPEPLDIPDITTDPRLVGSLVPSLIGANDSTFFNAVVKGDWEWHSPRQDGYGAKPGDPAYLDEQRSYWEGKTRRIPRTGLQVTAAGYRTMLLVDSDRGAGKKDFVLQVNSTCPPYTGNGAAGRIRNRIMTPYRHRTSASAQAPTPMCACFGFRWEDDMINNTDVRQAIVGLGHVTNVPVVSGQTPPNAPGLFIGKENASDVGLLYWQTLAGASGLNSSSTVFSELVNILAKDAITRPQVGVWYYFYVRWLLSYLSEGYIQLWLRSAAHFGGQITKVYERFGPNFYNDSYGTTAGIGQQDYHWDSVWTPPRTSHTQRVCSAHEFRDEAGPIELTPGVMFALLDHY